MDFSRNPAEEEAADNKAMALLANSPYKDKLAIAGLFLKALETRAPELSSLIRPTWVIVWKAERTLGCPGCSAALRNSKCCASIRSLLFRWAAE